MTIALEAGVDFVPAYPTIQVEILGSVMLNGPAAATLRSEHRAHLTAHGSVREVSADDDTTLRAGVIAEVALLAKQMRRPVRLRTIAAAGANLFAVHPDGVLEPISDDGALHTERPDNTIWESRCRACRAPQRVSVSYCLQCGTHRPHQLTVHTERPADTGSAAPTGIDAFTAPSRQDGWSLNTDDVEPVTAITERARPIRAATHQQGLHLAPTHPRLPRQPTSSAGLVVLGVHGGAGESSLAALLDATAADHAWPTPAGDAETVSVLLCARSNTRGLDAVQAAVMEWSAGTLPGIALLGVVISADAPGRPPKAVRDRIRHVTGGAPRTFELSWVDAWRFHPSEDPLPAPKPVAALVDDITRITTETEHA